MVQQQQAPGAADGEQAEPDLRWMKQTLGWGRKAQLEPFGGGLTVDQLNIGVYSEIPDHIPYRNRLPRGAFPSASAGSIGGYYLQDKYEQWSDHAGRLYEEGISRRWSTATHVPWNTARGLSDDVELALCQIATELSQSASIATEVVSGWLQNLSPGYHEVKLFLSTVVFDSARMFEGYRKRAMVNGGGMMLESPGMMNRALLETYAGWSQTVLGLWVVRGSLVTTILRYLSVYGPTEADRVLAARLIPDQMRASAYATSHIAFAISQQPPWREGFQAALTQLEAAQARELRDPALWEALAIVLGGGIENMEEGMAKVGELRQDWMRMYVDRSKQAGVDRTETMIGPFKMLLAGPEAMAAMEAERAKAKAAQAKEAQG